MKKIMSWAAAFLLLIALPFREFAGDQTSEVPEKSPLRLFSLSICEDHSAPPTHTAAGILPPLRLTFRAADSSLMAAPSGIGEFSLRSISRDFLKDAGQIWSYPVHIRIRDILPITSLSALTGFLIGKMRRSTGGL
jgi:hypothetical protein